MALKEEKIDQFTSAMFGLVNAIKGESELCCKLCGDVNEKELMVIAFVGDNKNVKMSDIAENLKAPLSTITSIADKLVANKFLTRYNSDEDRRVVNVSLTEKGRASYKVFLTQKKAMAKKVFSQFAQSEHDMLLNNINKLAKAMVS